jgi:hypothetical protein
MSHALNIHDGLGIIARDPALGILLAYGSTVPAGGVPGYAPGCRFIKTNGDSIGTVDYINIGSKTSANFVSVGLMGAIYINYVFGETTPIDAPFFVADRRYLLQALTARILVAGTDPSAVTAQIRKAASGTAISAGTLLHSGTINLKGAVDTNQTLTLVTGTANLTISINNAIGLDVTGTTTAARGVVGVLLLPY